VIHTALAKDPDRRYDSARAMELALTEAVDAASSGRHALLLPGRMTPAAIPGGPADGHALRPGGGAFHEPDAPGAPATALLPAPEFDITRREPAAALAPTPRVPALSGAQRDVSVDSEALTAVPEAPSSPETFSHRADRLLGRLGRDTATFCGTLLASVPLWSVFFGVNRSLERLNVEEFLPESVFLLAGLLSVIFARIAWHRYGWMGEKERKRTAIRYAVLGLFSGTIVPVVAVTFFVALKNATSSPAPAQNPEPQEPRIGPPPA
jgi:hypothetical protein